PPFKSPVSVSGTCFSVLRRNPQGNFRTVGQSGGLSQESFSYPSLIVHCPVSIQSLCPILKGRSGHIKSYYRKDFADFNLCPDNDFYAGKAQNARNPAGLRPLTLAGTSG